MAGTDVKRSGEVRQREERRSECCRRKESLGKEVKVF